MWAERAGTQVHLLLTDDPVVPPQGHAAVVAEDYDATLAALRAAGHPVESHPEHWGVPRAFATDRSWYTFSVIPVRTMPGERLLTRMPSRPNSCARTATSMIRAALLGP